MKHTHTHKPTIQRTEKVFLFNFELIIWESNRIEYNETSCLMNSLIQTDYNHFFSTKIISPIQYDFK